MSTMRPGLARCRGLRPAVTLAAALAAAFGMACLDDGPLSSGDSTDAGAPVRLSVQATVMTAATDRTVRIRTFYERADGSDVTLESTPRAVAVTPGVPRSVAVQVRVGPCLADTQRIGASAPGCQIGVELTLVDADETVLDQQTSGPGGPAIPGQTVTITEPITLVEVGAIAVDALPALRVGDSRTVTARATNNAGAPLVGRTFAWSSDNPSVATVNATGDITAVGLGTARVTATTGLKSGVTTVRVIRRVVAVSVSPDPAPSVTAAATQAFTVAAKDASGADAGDMAERTVTWSVANPAGAAPTASVSPNGVVTGVFPGDADVTVTVDGVAKTVRVLVVAAAINVTPPSIQVAVGARLRLQATVVDANNAPLAGVPVVWSSSNVGVATVSNPSGTVTGVTIGQATVTATGGGASGTASVSVVAPLAVTPLTGTVVAGRTLQLATTGGSGTVGWESSDPSVASVGPTGVVSGHYPGVVTITATTGSGASQQRATASITVNAASVVISQSIQVLNIEEQVTLHAAVLDANGASLPGVPITWSSDNPSVVSVDDVGTIFGAGVGETTIRAVAAGAATELRIRVENFNETFRGGRPPAGRSTPGPTGAPTAAAATTTPTRGA